MISEASKFAIGMWFGVILTLGILYLKEKFANDEDKEQ